MDLKGLGYLISIVSVILLGVVAWPSRDEPAWHAVVTVLGMAASVGGMGLRFLSHRKDRKDIEQAKEKAEASNGTSSGIRHAA